MQDHVWLIEDFVRGNTSSLRDERVKEILLAYFPNDYTICHQQEGKPYALSAQGPCPYFNISHSHNVLALGISYNEIGIDIEHKKNRKMLDSIAEEYFLPQERGDSNVYRAWTAREAFVKAQGKSIFNTIKRICISCEASPITIGVDGAFTHKIEFFALKNDYIGAVCRRLQNNNQLVFWDWSTKLNRPTE